MPQNNSSHSFPPPLSMTPQKTCSSGRVSDLRYFNRLVNSRYREISAAHRRRLEQRETCRRVKNLAGLMIDTDLAKRYESASCSGVQKPILTGPETAPDQNLDVIPFQKLIRRRSSDERTASEQEPKVKRCRPNHYHHERTEKLKIRIPASRQFLNLLRLRRSLTIPTVIRRHCGRWMLAKAYNDQRPRDFYDHPYDTSPAHKMRDIITIRIPALSGLRCQT